VIYDQARAKQWVDCGNRWAGNDAPFLLLDIQLLGHAEAPLLGFEGVLAELIMSGENSENVALFTAQCSALSTYWIFGFYEVLRKLKRESKLKFPALESIFHEVSVIRMPLAKHEVKGAPGYRKTGHYPSSIYKPETGKIGWSVFDPKKEAMTEVIRRDVADRFLQAVC
jgi:hypothetical protein